MLPVITQAIGGRYASIAAVSAAFDQVQADEDDPNVDPLEVYKKERQRLKRIKELDKEYKIRA